MEIKARFRTEILYYYYLDEMKTQIGHPCRIPKMNCKPCRKQHMNMPLMSWKYRQGLGQKYFNIEGLHLLNIAN